MTDRTNFDIATRIAAGDDGSSYDRIAIALHWATAVLVLIQFVTAFVWDWFPRPTRQTLEGLHTSLGVLLTVAIVARIAWRLMPQNRVASLELGWIRAASKAVHSLLYLMLIAQAGLGMTIGWAGGHPIHFFGLAIPGPIGALDRPFRRELREIHEWLGYAIVIIAVGHALAALYHHYVLKDQVLKRMLRAGA